VGFSGVLKGLKLTKPIMITTAIAYWVIGIPLGCTLAFKYNLGLYGLWMGLAIALLSAALISGSIIVLKLKQMESKRSNNERFSKNIL
jgi:MATE family multidrug resistance protein